MRESSDCLLLGVVAVVLEVVLEATEEAMVEAAGEAVVEEAVAEAGEEDAVEEEAVEEDAVEEAAASTEAVEEVDGSAESTLLPAEPAGFPRRLRSSSQLHPPLLAAMACLSFERSTALLRSSPASDHDGRSLTADPKATSASSALPPSSSARPRLWYVLASSGSIAAARQKLYAASLNKPSDANALPSDTSACGSLGRSAAAWR